MTNGIVGSLKLKKQSEMRNVGRNGLTIDPMSLKPLARLFLERRARSRTSIRAERSTRYESIAVRTDRQTSLCILRL